MDELPIQLLFGILGVLLLVSAFFSSSETGMMALNRYRLKHLQKEGHSGAKRASRLLKRPDRLIGLILVGNTLANNLSVAVTTLIAIRLLGEDQVALASSVSAVVLTFVVLIFAEVMPKTIAALHPEKVAFPAASVLTILLKLLYPVVVATNFLSNSLLKLIGFDPRLGNNEHLSSDELRTIVGEAGPHIPQRHQGMLLNILDLEQATVEDIMTPRNEIIGVDLNHDDQTLLEDLRRIEFTRIPVYRDDINNIVGVLHQRKASRVIDDKGNLDREQLMKEVQEPYFTPEATPLHTQLMNFQQQRRRLAIVVDEYGVVQGLATLEDILEEIVGKFTSNIADQEKDVHPQQDGTYIIDGTATIREVNKDLGWDLPSDGPKTINGLLMEQLESFPDAKVGLKVDNYYFEILEVKDNVVQTVKAFSVSTGESDQD